MNKIEFLAELKKGLSGLPKEDIEERLSFYSEMIDDAVEEGASECEAVGAIGEVKDVATQILADTPITKLVKERVKPNRALKVWELLLLILGSPVWLSLLLAAIAVVLAVYIVIWSLVITLWAVEASFAASSLGGVAAAIFFAIEGNTLTGLAMLGAAIFLAGLAIFLCFGCKAATKGMFILTGKIALGIKALFIGKENAK